MNTSIFKSIKEELANSTNPNNRSIVELCIIELSSGNFDKAIDLSEELVKKDINDSAGWAMKALSQAYLFDYANNIHFLKSSFAALEEFNAKTTLQHKAKMDIKAIFTATILSRTIELVNQRVKEVIDLQEQAKKEQTKSILTAATSVYAGSRFNSTIDKVMVYAAGSYVSSEFQKNAELLEEASKGVFGIAIANMAGTVEPAKTLKANLNELSFEVKTEATAVLKLWTKSMSELYLAVVASLQTHVSEVMPHFSLSNKKRSDENDMVNVINSPEAVQFIYLSKLLRMDTIIPELNSIINKMESIKGISVSQAKTDKNKGALIAGGFIFTPIVLLIFGGQFIESLPTAIGGTFALIVVFSLITGMGLQLYYMYYPYGTCGVLHSELRALKQTLTSLEVSANQIIIENIEV